MSLEAFVLHKKKKYLISKERKARYEATQKARKLAGGAPRPYRKGSTLEDQYQRQLSRDRLRKERKLKDPVIRAQINKKQASDYRKYRTKKRQNAIYYKYGLTAEAWQQLFESQDGRCAVCQIEDPGDKGFCVDHDHSRGNHAVRGLCCSRCNFLLGNAKDDTWILQRAIDYLERSRKDLQNVG